MSDLYQLPIKAASAEIRVLIDSEWFSASDLLDDVPFVLDCFLSDQQGAHSGGWWGGGFFIEADKNTISADEETDLVDEIHMHLSWLTAVQDILDGHPSSQVWAWEESGMKVVRLDDDTVVLSDQHHSGAVVCPPVRFSAIQWASAMVEAAIPFSQLVLKLHTLLTELDPDRDYPVAEPLCSKIVAIRNAFSIEWVTRTQRLQSRLSALRVLPPQLPSQAETPTLFALVEKRNSEEFLRHAKANPSELSLLFQGDTLLHRAAAYSCIDVVLFLLKQGADVRVQNKLGRTPLHQACAFSGSNMAVVELLVRYGSDIEARDSIGFTPLDCAAYVSSNREIVSGLIREGAKMGYPAAIFLRQWGYLDLLIAKNEPVQIKGLLRYIFQVILQDSGDQSLTNLDLAAQRWAEVIPKLVALGFPFETEGAELLRWSFEAKNLWSAKWLISLGVRGLEDEQRANLLELARNSRSRELIELAYTFQQLRVLSFK